MKVASAVAPATRARPLLIRGGTVLTLDERASVMPDTDLLLAEGRIQEIGSPVAPPVGCQILDVDGCLVLPGLIQGHIHLGQTFFRGLAEGRTLLAWLQERIWPLEAAHDDESAYWCALLGAAECLLSGTTTVQDIGLGPGARGLLSAIRQSGLRGLAGICLMDCGEGMPANLAGDTDTVLAETVSLGEEVEGWTGSRIAYLLNPRFILSCSDELWHGIRQLASEKGWPIHTHALEQKEESLAVMRLKGGLDEIAFFDETGILDSDLRIAHGVQLEARHLQRLSAETFSVVHCPSANLKLGSGIADVVGIRAAGIPVGIGADGAACNNDLDVLEEVRLAALLQQVGHGPASFSGLEALRLATSEGAAAIGLGDHVGSLEVGKAADLVVLGTDRPELLAASTVDLHDLVAFGASRASVRHVLVNGELLVEDGRLTRLNLEEIRQEASRCLEELLQRARF